MEGMFLEATEAVPGIERDRLAVDCVDHHDLEPDAPPGLGELGQSVHQQPATQALVLPSQIYGEAGKENGGNGVPTFARTECDSCLVQLEAIGR